MLSGLPKPYWLPIVTYGEETSAQNKQITRSRDEGLWIIKIQEAEGNLKSDNSQQKARTTTRKAWQIKDMSVWVVSNMNGL